MRYIQQNEPPPFVHMNPLSRNPGFAPVGPNAEQGEYLGFLELHLIISHGME